MNDHTHHLTSYFSKNCFSYIFFRKSERIRCELEQINTIPSRTNTFGDLRSRCARGGLKLCKAFIPLAISRHIFNLIFQFSCSFAYKVNKYIFSYISQAVKKISSRHIFHHLPTFTSQDNTIVKFQELDDIDILVAILSLPRIGSERIATRISVSSNYH